MDIIINQNINGFIMENLAGFTQMERDLMIIGSTFRNTDGYGRTALPFLFFTLLSIRIGTNTIHLVWNLAGLKDMWTKLDSAGEEYSLAD